MVLEHPFSEFMRTLKDGGKGLGIKGEVSFIGSESIAHTDKSDANSGVNRYYYYGIESGRRDNVTPFNISVLPKRMVMIKNNTNSDLDYSLCFYDSTENQDIDAMVIASNEYRLNPDKPVLLTNDFEILGQPFKGLAVRVKSRKDDVTGTYSIHMFGGI